MGTAHAQQPTFDRLSVEEGLSQSAVFDIRRDAHGLLWIGTQDGLNRYDGHRFIAYHHEPSDSTSISASWVTSVAQTSDGVFWIGTQGGGLNRMDPASGTFRTLPMPHPVVTRVAAAAEDVLWIGTYGGLVRYHPSTDSLTHFQPEPEIPGTLPSLRVLTLEVHPAGGIWLGTDRGGLAILDPATGLFTSVPLGATPADIVLSLYVDVDLSVWVGTAGAGLFHVSDDGDVLKHVLPRTELGVPARRINAISRDGNGDLWLGTDGAGLLRLDETTGAVNMQVLPDGSEHGLPAATVTHLLLDTSGIFWVGTNGGGMAKMREFGLFASTFPVMSVAESEETVWMGTDGGGLVAVDLATGTRRTWSVTEGIPHARILGLSVDGDQLWVATGGGLARLTPATGRVETWDMNDGLTDNRVFATAPAAGGQRWVATWQGLNLLDPATGRVRQFVATASGTSDLSSNRVIEVFTSSTGTVWAGTMGGGLNRQDAGAEGFEHLRPENERLSDGIVASVAEDASGGIWVGTANGLNRLGTATTDTGSNTGSESESAVYTTAHGLPNNTVYSVVEGTDGRIWMATNRGLAALAPESGDVQTFDMTDGLQNNEFNQGAVFRTPDGTLLFGGISGVTRFHPLTVGRPVDARVELTSVVTDAWALPPTALPGMDRMRMTPEDGALRIGFSSVDLRNPARLASRYRLRSSGSAWTELPPEDRSIMFNGLPGGTHDLEIEVAGAVRSLTIDVVPPFWATAWFRMLIGLGVLAAVWTAGGAVYRRRLRMVESRERAQTEIHRRLMQSREAERLRLSQELHDGAMQDLYGVRFRLSDDTSDMVQDVIRKLREICGELRPSVLTPFGLERAIRAFMDTTGDRHPELAVHLDLDEDGQSIPEEARLALYRIVQESVNNVIKHAEATRVDVAFRWDGRDVELRIEDNGRGFTLPPTWLDLGRAGHYGLLGLSERVRALDGQLDVDSKPGSGTQIRVRATVNAEVNPAVIPKATESDSP